MRWTLLLLVALGVGCVPKAKYIELETALWSEKTTVKARDVQLTEKNDALAAMRASVAELQTELERAEGRNAELSAEQEGMKAEIERLLAEKSTNLKEKGRLKASVAEMEMAFAEQAARRAAAERSVRAYHDLVERFRALIDAGKLQVRIVDGRMVVQLATDVLFASGQATLSTDGRAAIKEVGQVLASIPDRRYQVEGHTDNVPIRTERFPSNWELAWARSLTVVRALIEAGLAPEAVSGASFAETRPIGDNETPEGRASNRRIEIVIVPDLSLLPGTDELEAAAAASEAP